MNDIGTVLKKEQFFQTELLYVMSAIRNYTTWRVNNAKPSYKGVD